MYNPTHFRETRPDVLHALIETHPLATWVVSIDGMLIANHVPFLLDRDRGPHGTLVGHVARANPVWRSAVEGVLVFQAAEAYVSPSWYPSKRVHGKVVPTWNYAVVHVHGTAMVIEDRDWLRAIVERLTDAHEAARDGVAPEARWAVDDAPSDFVDTMLDAIIGIEIPIDRIEGKWKVSQNRAVGDRDGVVAGLRTEVGPDDAMAHIVAGMPGPTR